MFVIVRTAAGMLPGMVHRPPPPPVHFAVELNGAGTPLRDRDVGATTACGVIALGIREWTKTNEFVTCPRCKQLKGIFTVDDRALMAERRELMMQAARMQQEQMKLYYSSGTGTTMI